METLPGNFSRIARWLVVALFGLACTALAQEQPGPQPDAPPPAPVAAKEAPARPATNQTITVPAGTKFAVILQNGISTRSAKPDDSVYFQTAFPVTQDNRIVIPVGSYVRGSLLESKRPGRVKGKGEFRMRLDTLILPNGYTVNFNAAPRSADTGGKETMDSEGKISGPSDKGKDVGTIATTTAEGASTGAIVGAIRGRPGMGAGIGAGIGAAAGLATVLLTRGPEAELPRGSTLDIVLEHSVTLDADMIQFYSLGAATPVYPMPPRQQTAPYRYPYPWPLGIPWPM